MTGEALHRPGVWNAYHNASRSATYGFLAALPLLVLYELLIVFANRSAVAQVRVSSEMWLKQLLLVVGDYGLTAFGIAVLLAGIAVFWYDRKKKVPFRPRYFLWMFLESTVYAVVIAVIVSGLVYTVLPALAQAGPAGGVTMKLALSVGAGLYEELLFRVLLVGALFWVLRRLMGDRILAYTIAAVAGAFLFSLVHYIGPLGDAFRLNSFLFRMLFGLALNVLYLTRGFGIAAWTHALYDVMVMVVLDG